MFRVILLAVLFAWLSPVFAAEPVLTLRIGDETRRFTAAELLARPDAQTITMGDKDAYKRPMSYRAVPLLALLPSDERFDTLEVRATDGYAAQLPMALQDALLPASEEAEGFSFKEFVRRTAERAGMDASVAEIAVDAVLVTLRDAVTPGEFDDVLSQLPQDFKRLGAPRMG